MLSFSAETKRELCSVSIEKHCCATAESYGALLLGNTFSIEELRIVTTHECLAERLMLLLPKAFHVTPQLLEHMELGGKKAIAVLNLDDIRRIREAFGYGQANEVALHLNNAVLEQECCLASFWRGAFLAGGTVQDPEKAYHLELATPHRFLVRELTALLHESGLDAKCSERGGVQILYFKASENIEDFLTLTGACQSALSLMNIKVEKDLRNQINRRVNCDSANLDKTVLSSSRRRENILKLQKSEWWDKLSVSLREAAEVCLTYPEESLADLSERLGVGKSCLNHRLRKLEALASQINF